MTVPVDWTTLEVNDQLSGRSTSVGSVNYTVRDIWNPAAKPFTTLATGKGKQRGQLVPVNTQVVVGSHDVAAFRLTPKL